MSLINFADNTFLKKIIKMANDSLEPQLKIPWLKVQLNDAGIIDSLIGPGECGHKSGQVFGPGSRTPTPFSCAFPGSEEVKKGGLRTDLEKTWGFRGCVGVT